MGGRAPGGRILHEHPGKRKQAVVNCCNIYTHTLLFCHLTRPLPHSRSMLSVCWLAGRTKDHSVYRLSKWLSAFHFPTIQRINLCPSWVLLHPTSHTLSIGLGLHLKHAPYQINGWEFEPQARNPSEVERDQTKYNITLTDPS